MSYDHDEQNPILNDYYIPANLIPASGDDIDMPDVVETRVDDIDNEDDSKKKNSISNINIKSLVSGMTDVYTTQQEAEDRAVELGGSGSHQHTYDGEPVFMPFESHDEYMDAVDDEKYDKYIGSKAVAKSTHHRYPQFVLAQVYPTIGAKFMKHFPIDQLREQIEKIKDTQLEIKQKNGH